MLGMKFGCQLFFLLKCVWRFSNEASDKALNIVRYVWYVCTVYIMFYRYAKQGFPHEQRIDPMEVCCAVYVSALPPKSCLFDCVPDVLLTAVILERDS